MDQDIIMDDMQISALQTTEPTLSPTPGETAPLTEGESESPTSSPTTMPTVSDVTNCPSQESTPSELSSGGPVMLARSSTLCILTKATSVDGDLTKISPVALSYDGGDWEKAAGDIATSLLYGQEFGDYTDGSHITLPALDDEDARYYITSYSRGDVNERDKLARFFETATFGTTSNDLASWDKGDLTTETAKEWVSECNTTLVVDSFFHDGHVSLPNELCLNKRLF